MAKPIDKLAAEIRNLSDIEKLRLVDAIWKVSTSRTRRSNRIWAEEARKRWNAFKAGEVSVVPYETVMAKHRRP